MCHPKTHTITLLLLLLLGMNAPIWAKDPLTIGVFPRRNAVVTHAMFTPLSDYLTQQLGTPVTLLTSKDFKEFWQRVEQRRFDIVHFNQYHYLRAHHQYGYEVVARNMEGGTPTSSGGIVVRNDSGIKDIQGLRGKRIIFGGSRKAMQSYIIATYLLRQGGLQAGDYEELFAKNPINGVLATYHHQADAAGAGMNVLTFDSVTNNADANELHLLALGPQLPHIPWAVNAQLPLALQHQIQTLLLGLEGSETGIAILKGMMVDRLLPANDADFDYHRRIIAEVLGEHY